jgi:hypothetical protein
MNSETPNPMAKTRNPAALFAEADFGFRISDF